VQVIDKSTGKYRVVHTVGSSANPGRIQYLDPGCPRDEVRKKRSAALPGPLLGKKIMSLLYDDPLHDHFAVKNYL
jgi:hypothetical protein